MPISQTQREAQRELEALADHGATLSELLDHAGDQNGRLGRFSDDQQEELEVYCWRVHGDSRGAFSAPRSGYGGGRDDDIGG
jgi:hypothetical protein